MASTLGNKVVHRYLTRAEYDALATPDEDTLYIVVEGTGQMSVYKGSYQQQSFRIVTSLPTTGVLGKLYYNSTDLCFYFYSGSAWVLEATPYLTSTGTINSSSTDTQTPTAKAVYNAIAAIEVSGGSTQWLAPVQDLTALAALAGMADKDTLLVEDSGAIFHYDATSTATADGLSIITPTGAPGRWIKIKGSFDIDSTYLEFNASGVLTIKSSWISTLSTLALTSTAASALATTASAGSSIEAARADHVHPTTGLALESDIKWVNTSA